MIFANQSFSATLYARSSWLLIRNLSETKQSHNEDSYEDDIKCKILEASLPFVAEHGWTKNALSAGAISLGYPGVAHGLFPNGGADLIHHFQKTSNDKLIQKLKEQTQKPNFSKGRVLVKEAVETRLKMIVPYLTRWPQAIAIMSLPQNVSTSLATLLTLADDICYYAGDRSVDFSWYARRVAVAGVYKATELYLIQDTSHEFEKSWKFLDNRLTELTQLHNLANNTDTGGFGNTDAIKSAFITARNIIGLDWNR